MTRRVLIVCPYPKGAAPGQRFRFEQYLDILKKAGIEADMDPFFSDATMSVLYRRGYVVGKALGVAAGFLRRLRTLLRLPYYDYVFLFREASPIGPPIFETLMFLLRKKIVYDFDDAIFIAQPSESNPFFRSLRWNSKVAFICKHSRKVSVCNPYLVDWVSKYNRNATLIPTTIDASYHHPSKDGSEKSVRPVIGWTGSQSTAGYLDMVRPVLKSLQEKHDFEFRVICDHDPGFPELKHYRFVPWRLETEVADLSAFDIGLMPVPEGPWEKGKVGFKAIQYSALEITPVVSSTGSGGEVVENNVTGFVVDSTESAWYNALDKLLSDKEMIKSFGRAARAYIIPRYSVAAMAQAYIRLFNE